ncbi:Uncharacterized conserved protein YabE, contains G5 and tandem DUF348 domains [Amycolatopsis xylanica]|uniref:Uncharacterized conserved protein YabE, contains G5 and tandem DUF348 domains n=1 Tax=Amycolatopsis xylanica TaxID=589385 RepID=A0A1H3EQ87_9PSEU|nr:Uncharacterized conserved protein YabE, contains G5 and tandem DUF348 domains [Amycolatopsis xylanica]
MTGTYRHADARLEDTYAHGSPLATLDRPAHGELDFSDDLAITHQDVLAALGPDAEVLMNEIDVDVDELIRLINAETTYLPPIVIPDEVSEDRVARQEQPLKVDPVVAATKTWKKRFLKGAVVAVLLTLTGGGAAALAMNKSVTVEVDGVSQTVHTYGDTVGEVLEDAELSVGAHDSLSPSPQAEVGDGGVIHLERGRQLNLVVDGAPAKQNWVRATNLGDALGQLGMTELLKPGTWTSMASNGALPLEGATVEVKTLKNIVLYDGGTEAKQLKTNAVTTKELLGELKLALGPEDEAEGGLDLKLTDGAEVHVSRTGVTMVKEKETIAPPEQKVDDPELDKGKTSVEDPGQAGEKIVTYKVTKKNDKEVGREQVSEEILTEAKPKIIHVGTKKPPISIGDGSVWDQLAKCEAGGNWAANTGNGYYGGLQFNKSTWDAYGGSAYASLPSQASREEQISIAEKVRAGRGGSYSAWPACSRKLGLG